jgi:hypothetical protein
MLAWSVTRAVKRGERHRAVGVLKPVAGPQMMALPVVYARAVPTRGIQ